ncbi:hypothetical protein ACHQM5_017706 [Ranunculus cassubicifolius]
MEFIGYTELIFAVVCFLFLHHLNSKKLPTNWPLIGMLPSLLLNLHRVLDFCTYFLSKNDFTFVFKGVWFTTATDIVITSDPANIRYIFNTNFSNYPKGPEFKELFDVLGDGIFNVDSDEWKHQRRVAQQIIHDKKFISSLEQSSCSKVQDGLIPVLDHVVEQNLVIDMQDMFKRFTFDNNAIMLSGTDPCCLTKKFEKFACVDAFDDIEEAIFYRHALPEKWWKLQRWLGVGIEKKLSDAREVLDQFISQCISNKREKIKAGENEKKGVDLLTLYMAQDEAFGSKSEIFLRDTMFNFMFAGRNTVSATLTWFFFLLSKNPKVEMKIIEELESKGGASPEKMFDMEKLKGCVYLYSALCECLRIFPTVPFEHKRPAGPDVLPSGHVVDSNSKIMPVLYAMGRMEALWGKDCLEFRPERWISASGGVDYVPSYKFMAFNSGPRTCLGKEIAFTQMRMVAATILYNYHTEVDENHSIAFQNSTTLYMKHGMKVRLRRRF